jgi:tetratricopeptide (TPR) repeat protein
MTLSVDDVRLLIARGEVEAALAALDRRLETAPADAEALLVKAGLLLERRQDAAALALCERAVAAAPRSAAALNSLARCLHASGRDDEALAAARAARDTLSEGENFRETSSVYLTLVWSLRALRRHAEAVAVAEEGLLRCPDAILAQWAGVVEEELAEMEREGC